MGWPNPEKRAQSAYLYRRPNCSAFRYARQNFSDTLILTDFKRQTTRWNWGKSIPISFKANLQTTIFPHAPPKSNRRKKRKENTVQRYIHLNQGKLEDSIISSCPNAAHVLGGGTVTLILYDTAEKLIHIKTFFVFSKQRKMCRVSSGLSFASNWLKTWQRGVSQTSMVQHEFFKSFLHRWITYRNVPHIEFSISSIDIIEWGNSWKKVIANKFRKLNNLSNF